MTPAGLPLGFADVKSASARLQGVTRRTPLLPLTLPGQVYAKPESLQVTGSFKLRGAYNKIASLDTAVRSRGVVADSSGNHAQGVACAAHLLGVPATIVIPENAPPIKVERTAGWGAEIVRCGNSSDERLRVASQIARERNLTYVPPFDDQYVAAGQGTAGLEVAEDLPDLDTILVPVGGGGLISGIAVAVKALCPKARVIGVEPEVAADAQESLRKRERVGWSADRTGSTIADGVRTQKIGELNFAVMSALVDEIITVPEAAIPEAVRWYALETKLAVEPTGALTLAAVRSGAFTPTGPTVLLVSGGNFDPRWMSGVLAG